MAEAPGPPRKSTTYQRQEGMNSQRERFGVKPNEMFWLENVMRVAPKKLHSVPGPRNLTFFPRPVPPVCEDTTERGQQLLTMVLQFDNANSFPLPASIVHSAYGLYVTVDGEYYSMTGNANCAGGNMAYTDGCVVVSHFTDFNPNVFDHPPLVPPQNVSLPAVNVMNGPSDEPMYCFQNGGSVDLYYINDDFHVQHLFTVAPPNTGLNPNHFAKKGDLIYYNPIQTVGIGDPRRIVVYEARANVFVAKWATLSNRLFDSFWPTDNFLYVLNFALDFSDAKVSRLDLDDGSLIDELDVTALAAGGVFPVDDQLCYLLCRNSTYNTLYYIKNFTDVIYVGRLSNPDPLVSVAFSAVKFQSGRFFFGGNGRNIDVHSDIKAFEVACPDGDAEIATVSVDAGTVQRGNPINATWADILAPASDDRLVLCFDDGLLYNPSATILATGGIEAGTLPFTIPGGATPGTYYIALATQLGATFMAKSDTFTVTA